MQHCQKANGKMRFQCGAVSYLQMLFPICTVCYLKRLVTVENNFIEIRKALIKTMKVFLGLSIFFPSHCKKQFFRCYRLIKTKSNFFVHSTHHKFYYGNFGYLGLDFRLKIRKLWLKRWFCTVCQEYVLLCVTWKTKEVLVQNWLLKMLNFFFNVISICHEGPRKSITTTWEVCFKANSHNTVWNVTHN